MFSLHAQGWPVTAFPENVNLPVLPARAGMARDWDHELLPIEGSPCTRRDGPYLLHVAYTALQFSLHAQGWPAMAPGGLGCTPVLPARAGMARVTHALRWPHLSSPCTRRDGPSCDSNGAAVILFSLHAQGWPGILDGVVIHCTVLPARAGMALIISSYRSVPISSPCTRRDGPPREGGAPWYCLFSLHAQGWPELRDIRVLSEQVLPARAGMARSTCGTLACTGCSPCTRRDGPIARALLDGELGFSLHAQGWPRLTGT